ncbi:glycosyltransferase [Sphingosinicella rhizophila]|uniref:Glycosyltransferase n=1 Tax=Sphingosinicella rhizophila TaxID=3050082 RepID=A0ABU3Q666_9SPHN|nr:glycosyltransferase [Sphingosinicella sp. GR2756]MDT9598899.1 glycosyltransferase [Sphingosinicella sp. GR2756]
MRILHLLASRGPGGSEALVRDLATEHVKNGSAAAIAFISKAREVGNSPSFEQRFAEILAKGSVQTFDLGHHSRRNPLYGAWRLLTVYREFRPDILHIHLLSGLLFRLLLWPRKIPTIYTHHTSHLKISRRAFRLLMKGVDQCVAISRQGRALLEASTTVPVTVIRNAVAFEGIQRRSSSTNSITILSVGRLYRDKGYETLIDVADRIFQQRPDLTGTLIFQIAGEGPERSNLEQQIEARGLKGKVVLLGLRSDVKDLLLASDIFLMTSLWEGLPISLIEALHAGLPIVATDVGGCGEVVEQSKNGFLAAPRDAVSLAGYLLRLIEDPHLTEGFRAGSVRLARDFGMDACAERHLILYRSVVDRVVGDAPCLVERAKGR